MNPVCFLTPDPEDEDYHLLWRDTLAHLVAALARAGIGSDARGWTEAGDLTGYGLVMPLLVWGYHRACARWIDHVTAWEREGVDLRNPANALRWNADKSYLGMLAERGAPVVPTIYVDRMTEAALEDAAARFGVDRLVAKPRVSATAWRTIRWARGGSLEGGPEGAAMIQPYLPAIESEGEVSLIHIGGNLSHAIRKRPRAGDFRVQPEYDGILTPHDPALDEIHAARRILAAIDGDLLYARVDLVRDDAVAPVLMELELVEPDLSLEFDPGKGALFAEAVAGELTKRQRNTLRHAQGERRLDDLPLENRGSPSPRSR
ncbi:MAG: transporter [Sphingomonadaceae bacterium]|nr:transporter [Sphingomonadaceae bacterium]